MERKEKNRASRRWRTLAVLALGVAIGTVLMASPASAHIKSVAHLWNVHIKPKTDARYAKASATRTIQGVYALGLVAGPSGGNAYTSISFGFELASAPTPHYVASGAVPPAECPGTAANPIALPGHLCLYEWSQFNASGFTFIGADQVNAATRWGVALLLQSASPSLNFYSRGTWVVTAPLGTNPG